jgi:hypothetical protein
MSGATDPALAAAEPDAVGGATVLLAELADAEFGDTAAIARV